VSTAGAATLRMNNRLQLQIWIVQKWLGIKDLGVGGPDLPQMEPTDQLDAANRRLPEGCVRRFAKRRSAARPVAFFSPKFFSFREFAARSDLAGVGSESVVVPRRRDILGTAAGRSRPGRNSFAVGALIAPLPCEDQARAACDRGSP
jgi:hypothetical protein